MHQSRAWWRRRASGRTLDCRRSQFVIWLAELSCTVRLWEIQSLIFFCRFSDVALMISADERKLLISRLLLQWVCSGREERRSWSLKKCRSSSPPCFRSSPEQTNQTLKYFITFHFLNVCHERASTSPPSDDDDTSHKRVRSTPQLTLESSADWSALTFDLLCVASVRCRAERELRDRLSRRPLFLIYFIVTVEELTWQLNTDRVHEK